ncbi:MAG: hypothetical protein WKF91_01065 [Segetibacter sp.]
MNRRIALLFAMFFLCQTLFVSTASSQISIPRQNMISNGDFMSRDPQQRPLHWVLGKGMQTATISSEERHSSLKDDQSLKIEDTANTSNVLVRSVKTVANPGTNYIATGWVKSKSGTPATFSIEFWDQNDKRIAIKSVTPSPAAEWKEQTIITAAPDKCTHVTVSINTTKIDQGISYWDDVKLVYEEVYNPQLINGRREMFVDDYRIQDMRDVQRVVNSGVKSKPLINPTEPWEGTSVYIYGTVLHNQPDSSNYRMWYTCYLTGNYYLCYATSIDGIMWVKPKLGLVDFNGSKQNNICKVGGGTLVYDPVDKDASKRYKLMVFDGGKEKFGYGVHFSPDGFNWTAYDGNPVLTYGDVSNVAYDVERGLFIATTKQRMLISNTSVTPGKNDREAFLSVSKDFINWSAPGAAGSPWTLVVEGDHLDDMLVMSKGGIEANIYGMPVYPYEGIYIGMPWVFDINTYNIGEYAVTGDGKIEPQIAASRDLRHWSRPCRDPLIPIGKSGSWDDGTLYTASTLQLSEKEINLYYGAMNLTHGGNALGQTQYGRIAKAKWRRDGFVSLYNDGDDTGFVTTKVISFDGNELKVNAKVNAGGSLKVEILDTLDKPIEGYKLTQAQAITGDQYSKVVTWQDGSTLEKLLGRKVKLRFYLDGGNLFSYWIEK